MSPDEGAAMYSPARGGWRTRRHRRVAGGALLLAVPGTAALVGPFVTPTDIPSDGMPYARGDGHPLGTCEQLTRSGKAVHHTTVYRTLEALTAVGLTHAVHGPGATRYGITGEPHHHTACQQCGRVAALASRHVTEAVGRIEELTGLRPGSSGSLLVFGRCSGCSG
ncbi:transcriptional repressor [Streptomyces antimycoticus]|uniref:Fur family transcriptional regulator n=1 Tax=Streptomyces antimycoticus TaxID=68175 RepID=UPI003423160B